MVYSLSFKGEILDHVVKAKFKTVTFLLSWLVRPLQYLFNKTPKAGAQTTLFCALDPNLENETGKYYSYVNILNVLGGSHDYFTARVFQLNQYHESYLLTLYARVNIWFSKF